MASGFNQANRLVKVSDKLAAWVITLGGMSTIVAVLGVFVFLVWTVIPLFQKARINHQITVELPRELCRPEAPSEDVLSAKSSDPVVGQDPQRLPHSTWLAFGLDDSITVAWAVSRAGHISVWDCATGNVLIQESLLDDTGAITCGAVDPRTSHFVFGTAQGTARGGRFRVDVRSPEDAEIPPEVQRQFQSRTTPHLIVRTAEATWWRDSAGKTRRVSLQVSRDDPVRVGETPVVLIHSSSRGETRLVAALTQDGLLHIGSTEKRLNFLTGEETVTFSGGECSLSAELGGDFPDFLGVSGVGDSTYLIWRDGRLLRIDSRVLNNLQIVERLKVVEEGDRISAFAFLIGKNTLLFGTEKGAITAWFPTKPEGASTADGVTLVKAHTFLRGPAAVAALAASHRTRLFAAGYQDGTVRIFHATSQQLVVASRLDEGSSSAEAGSGALPVSSGRDKSVNCLGVAIAPKDDGLALAANGQMALWQVSAVHAGVTWQSIFGRVWYEGYPQPAFVWQSSSGTDDFEPKYSLTPLIFGTVKATVFAMIFAVPLALLAAVYTSEVLHRNVRAYIKPGIELMAGLPSVVLGFLAALVFAPWVESRLPQVLALFYTIPFSLLLAGHVTQVLPQSWQRLISRYRVWGILLVAALGVQMARWVGPIVEAALFQGDLKAWLNGRFGTGTPGWMFALVPLTAVVVAFLHIRWLEPKLRRVFPFASRQIWAWLKLGLFLFNTVLTLIAAWFIGWGLTEVLGIDPRGLFLGTYIQRNAFIVGFVMGFAVIPIIYTIAEDALTAVPDHLRAASLGAGATPWQTAVWVVIPTAMSGLFSALMIGLGRAAGETMIVLMAAGNTPIMEWNIFSGFRTLSANIAVELPEAVQYSTHYRMLFLAGLCLFLITFVVNTIAEIVRLRFRKKAFQL